MTNPYLGSRISEATEAEEQYSDDICVVGRDLTDFNIGRYGSFIRRIDLSFNFLMKVRGLEGCAGTLEELILDNNQLTRIDLRTNFSKLNTLSLNKNRITNLTLLLKDVKSKASNLRYLSLLGNPICPDQLSVEYVGESEYADYRCHILFHLPSLRFLDHRIVSSKELSESKKYSYANITASFTPLPNSSAPSATFRASQSLTENNSDGRSGSENDRNGNEASADPMPRRGKQGRRRFKYVGKNSEGNRFIKDSDL